MEQTNPHDEPPYRGTSFEGLASCVNEGSFAEIVERLHRRLYPYHDRSALRPLWDELAARIESDLLRQNIQERDASAFAPTIARYFQMIADKFGDDMVTRHGCVSFSTPICGHGGLDFELSGPGFRREARFLFRERRWWDLHELNPLGFRR